MVLRIYIYEREREREGERGLNYMMSGTGFRIAREGEQQVGVQVKQTPSVT